MLKKRYLPGKVLAGITLGLLCAGISAQQFDRDIRLAKELNAINLQDYAQNLIDSLLETNKDVPELLAQQAENFVVQGKMDEANKIIAKLPKGSPAYYQAQAGIGVYFVQRRQFAEGLPMLQEVKDYAQANNLLKSFELPLQWLLQAYQDQGKAAEAQELLAILAAMNESGSETSKREMMLAQARYGLSCIENMKETVDKKHKELKAEYDQKWKAAYSDPKKKKDLDTLNKRRNDAWNVYQRTLQQGNAKAAAVHRTNYENAYKNIAKKIGMDEKAAVELSALEKVKALQPSRKNIILKGRTRLTPQETAILAIKDPNDWQDVIYDILCNMEEVQWGGLDSCFFMAVANIIQAQYHLGQHELALNTYKKNASLFKQCDAEYKKNPALAIENSPTADARMWEGYNCIALAQNLEKSPKAADKAAALKYYKQAFVAFGQLLMNYPKHRDGAKNYPVLLDVVEKIKTLDPKIANKLDAQVARVPKPELKKSASAEIEELVAPLPAQEFKEGSRIASDNQQKDRTPQKSTDADWAKCREHFAVVEKELAPVLAGNRRSSGLPKVLNHLLISYGYLGDVWKLHALSELSEFMFRDDGQVHHGIVVGANALWIYAERFEKAGYTEQAKLLQDKTMEIYEIFLRVAPSHPYAPNVAMRLAGVEYIRADQLGKAFNEEKDTAKREQLRKERIAGFDRAIARFDFILNNFANRAEFVDRAYELGIEAYRLTKRYEKAAEMGERFCSAGAQDPNKILKAKMDIAANLYNYVLELKEANDALRKDAERIVEPIKPAAPVDTKDAAAQTAYEAAMKAYDAAMVNYKELSLKKQEMLDKVAASDKKIRDLSIKAIDHIEGLRKWMAPKGEFADIATNEKSKEVSLRADMIMPWLCDAADDFENCIKEFDNFINKYPDHAQVPAYLMQTGMLYMDKGDIDKAGYYFNKLASEHADKPEGKNVKYFLAISLYDRGRIKESLEVFNEILSKPDLKNTLNTSSYRWISSKMLECKDPEQLGNAAILSLLASKELFARISASNLVLSDWVDTATASRLEQDKDQLRKYIATMQERFRMSAANAATIVGKEFLKAAGKDPANAAKYGEEANKYFVEAVGSYNAVVPENMKQKSDSPFYYDVLFNRAEIYRIMKNYDKAAKDLIAASRRANGSVVDFYNKAQTMLGNVYCEQAEATGNQDFYKKAHAAYMIIAALPFPEPAKDSVVEAVKKGETKTADEIFREKAAAEGAAALEEAVFKSAKTASILGNEEAMKKMVEKYAKYYPTGKFIGEARRLSVEKSDNPNSEF